MSLVAFVFCTAMLRQAPVHEGLLHCVRSVRYLCCTAHKSYFDRL
jgi:predicted HD phosphohydrolase